MGEGQGGAPCEGLWAPLAGKDSPGQLFWASRSCSPAGTSLSAVCPFLPLLKEKELAFSLLSPVLPNLPTQQKSQLHTGLLCKRRGTESGQLCSLRGGHSWERELEITSH